MKKKKLAKRSNGKHTKQTGAEHETNEERAAGELAALAKRGTLPPMTDAELTKTLRKALAIRDTIEAAEAEFQKVLGSAYDHNGTGPYEIAGRQFGLGFTARTGKALYFLKTLPQVRMKVLDA